MSKSWKLNTSFGQGVRSVPRQFHYRKSGKLNCASDCIRRTQGQLNSIRPNSSGVYLGTRNLVSMAKISNVYTRRPSQGSKVLRSSLQIITRLSRAAQGTYSLGSVWSDELASPGLTWQVLLFFYIDPWTSTNHDALQCSCTTPNRGYGP